MDETVKIGFCDAVSSVDLDLLNVAPGSVNLATRNYSTAERTGFVDLIDIEGSIFT